MKKCISIVVIGMLICSLAGCGVSTDSDSGADIKELEQRIEELEAENEELKDKLAESKEEGNNPLLPIITEQETWTDDTIISFGDASFIDDIKDFTGVTERDITYGDVKYITKYDTCKLKGYGNYNNLSALRYFTSLEELSVWGGFSSLNGIENLANLKTLTIEKCENLTDISALSGLTNLETLSIEGCENLTDISVLSSLTNLESLSIMGCTNLTDASALGKLTSIKSLEFHTDNWKEFDWSILLGLETLEKLSIRDRYASEGAPTTIDGTVPVDIEIRHVTLDNLQEWVDTH